MCKSVAFGNRLRFSWGAPSVSAPVVRSVSVCVYLRKNPFFVSGALTRPLSKKSRCAKHKRSALAFAYYKTHILYNSENRVKAKTRRSTPFSLQNTRFCIIGFFVALKKEFFALSVFLVRSLKTPFVIIGIFLNSFSSVTKELRKNAVNKLTARKKYDTISVPY